MQNYEWTESSKAKYWEYTLCNIILYSLVEEVEDSYRTEKFGPLTAVTVVSALRRIITQDTLQIK